MMTRHRPVLPFALALAAAVALVATLGAQDRLKTMPGYDQYQKMSKELVGAVKPGALSVTWKDARTFEYVRDGKLYRFDVAARSATEVGPAPDAGMAARGRRMMGVERGRQAASTPSPDGTLKAFYKDRNLYLSAPDGSAEIQVTTDGSGKDRIKYATASWVYGEELDQNTAMWWSPDSRLIGYYRFDEQQVPDYYLEVDQTKLYSRIDTEAYPKAGEPNPIVDLFVYDVATKKSTKIDVRDGKPFDNSVVGHYVYKVRWSPDGKELLFQRMNRRQNVLELVAANPSTGACRVVVHEEWPTGWIDGFPEVLFLEDGRRFIWSSERNGWKNYYLYDLAAGKLLNALTSHTGFEAGSLVKVDEDAKAVFYTARDGDNYMKMQLHRVGFDGKGDARLTDPAFDHSAGNCLPAPTRVGLSSTISGGVAAGSCGISPDNRFFVDIYQAHDVAPATRLVDATTGKAVVELAASDMTRFNELRLKKAEMFTYKAADGKTTLHGLVMFPSNFDPSKRYPVLLSVYGGPAAAGSTARESWVGPNSMTEYGFLLLNLDSRSTPGMGKRLLDSVYLNLGVTEMDDMAEGVKALWNRPYVDKDRVGVFGTSYGGYSSLMCLLRHPEAFRAASASSPASAWINYDTIYTERYMWLPQENKAGYEAGSAVALAGKLDGRLMLYYGTADNNVHPSNSLQLIQALQRAGKSFEVQVGPDAGHSGLRPDRMMEFFIENLVMNRVNP